jgi:hypothetical protein
MTPGELRDWLGARRALLNQGVVGKKHWVIVFSVDDPECHNVRAIHDDPERALHWAMAVFDLTLAERRAMQFITESAEPAKC